MLLFFLSHYVVGPARTRLRHEKRRESIRQDVKTQSHQIHSIKIRKQIKFQLAGYDIFAECIRLSRIRCRIRQRYKDTVEKRSRQRPGQSSCLTSVGEAGDRPDRRPRQGGDYKSYRSHRTYPLPRRRASARQPARPIRPLSKKNLRQLAPTEVSEKNFWHRATLPHSDMQYHRRWSS